MRYARIILLMPFGIVLALNGAFRFELLYLLIIEAKQVAVDLLVVLAEEGMGSFLFPGVLLIL